MPSVAAYLRTRKTPARLVDIQRGCGCRTRQAAYSRIERALKAGTIEKVGRGLYKPTPPRRKR